MPISNYPPDNKLSNDMNVFITAGQNTNWNYQIPEATLRKISPKNTGQYVLLSILDICGISNTCFPTNKH